MIIKLLSSDLNGNTICDVDVRLYSNSEVASPVTAFKVLNNDWGEESITWNNAPEIGTAFTTTQVVKEKQYYEWDITNYFTSQAIQKGVVSVNLEDFTEANADVFFNSKESDENPPELVLFQMI